MKNHYMNIPSLISAVMCLVILPSLTSAKSCLVPPSELISWWPGDQNACDIVSQNNGEIFGNVSFFQGKVLAGFTFGANTGRVTIPDSNDLRLTSDFTIDFWAAASTTQNANAKMIGKADSQGGYSIEMDSVPGSNRYYAGWISLDGKRQCLDSAPFELSTALFQHVAVVKKAASRTVYIDGVMASSATCIASTASIAESSAPFEMGSSSQNNNRAWWGILDEVQIYNRALSAEEIRQIYDADGSGECKSKMPFASRLKTQTPNGVQLQSSLSSSDNLSGSAAYYGALILPVTFVVSLVLVLLARMGISFYPRLLISVGYGLFGIAFSIPFMFLGRFSDIGPLLLVPAFSVGAGLGAVSYKAFENRPHLPTWYGYSLAAFMGAVVGVAWFLGTGILFFVIQGQTFTSAFSETLDALTLGLGVVPNTVILGMVLRLISKKQEL